MANGLSNNVPDVGRVFVVLHIPCTLMNEPITHLTQNTPVHTPLSARTRSTDDLHRVAAIESRWRLRSASTAALIVVATARSIRSAIALSPLLPLVILTIFRSRWRHPYLFQFSGKSQDSSFYRILPVIADTFYYVLCWLLFFSAVLFCCHSNVFLFTMVLQSSEFWHFAT